MELLIVIALLGILTMIGITSFQASTLKGRDSRRKQDIKNVALALEAYFNDKASYPASDASGNIMGCGAGATAVCTWGSIWKNTTTNTTYMVQLSKDPSSATYKYYYVKSGSWYKLYAYLENTQDGDIITPSQANTNCGVAAVTECRYGVSSPNTTP